jgi:hypothetical protein
MTGTSDSFDYVSGWPVASGIFTGWNKKAPAYVCRGFS